MEERLKTAMDSTIRRSAKTSNNTSYRREKGSVPPDVSAEVFLSVVIPAYNEALRIPSTLPRLLAYLRDFGEPYEVVVVDDGSTDETFDVVEKLALEFPGVRPMRNTVNSGKGFAVRQGMLAARGEFLLFTDADLSAPINEAERLLGPLRSGYDVVIGSRALKREWIGVHQSSFRETAGKLFNFVLRRTTGLTFSDTQCGFKGFRREAARTVFSRQTTQGFGFDVEVLYLARKFGLKVLEVPVHWDHTGASKVRPVRDGAWMLLDLLKIRWNDWTGKYALPTDEIPL